MANFKSIIDLRSKWRFPHFLSSSRNISFSYSMTCETAKLKAKRLKRARSIAQSLLFLMNPKDKLRWMVITILRIFDYVEGDQEIFLDIAVKIK